MKFHLLTISILLAASAMAEPNPPPSVVPAVRQWTGGEGVLKVDATRILVAAGQKELLGVADQLKSDLAATVAGSVAVVPAEKPAPGSIFLALKKAGNERPAGNYQIEIAGSVTISSDTPTGIFYGTRTLLQMLAQSKDRMLPKGTITDWPDSRGRMFMLDVGRKPTPIPVLKDYIRMLAWYKMNEFHIHFSDEAFGGTYSAFRVQCDTFPGLTAKDLFYTKAELRDLQDFAKARGVTITPEFDMPGHARCFTNYWPDCMLKVGDKKFENYLDVTNPKTIENLKKLLDEMIPLFDAPDVHIGTDEYRVGDQPELHEAFRKFINTMNAHIRSKGKNCRIWSGFEHMKGTTEIDSTVIIDMWETDDAKGQIAKGHKIINSNHGRTYIVPGAHYYGISCGGIYNGWEPWMVSGDNAKNPTKDDPNLLGGKLHVWMDHGPTGWTMTEIADAAMPGIQAFAEKLWGTKGSPNYEEFQKRAATTLPVPGVTVFNRLRAKIANGLILDLPAEQTLANPEACIDLPLAKADRANLEYPWTLTMEICKTAASSNRGVILSSEFAEVCAGSDTGKTEEIVTVFADGTKRRGGINTVGVGMVRAAGARQGKDPFSTYLAHDVSKFTSKAPGLNEWTSIAITGTRGGNTIYINGEKAGSFNNQMVCPLRWLGSRTGNSFVGKVRKLKVYDCALTAKEIARAAGADIPEDLAAGGKATASATEGNTPFTADKATDGDDNTRWCSGSTGAAQSLAIDLGTAKIIGRVAIAWRPDAYPKKYAVEASADGRSWKEVFTGEGKPGNTLAEFPATKTRHFRVKMSDPATQWGYSLWSVEAYAPKKQGPK